MLSHADPFEVRFPEVEEFQLGTLRVPHFPNVLNRSRRSVVAGYGRIGEFLARLDP